MNALSRRNFLLTSAYATAGFASTASLPAFGQSSSRYLDLQDPEDALTAMIKMRGSLEAVDCPHWYCGTIYAVLPGKSPLALIDFEGSEIDYYAKQADGSYKAYGATVSFFKDTQTLAIYTSSARPDRANMTNRLPLHRITRTFSFRLSRCFGLRFGLGFHLIFVPLPKNLKGVLVTQPVRFFDQPFCRWVSMRIFLICLLCSF